MKLAGLANDAAHIYLPSVISVAKSGSQSFVKIVPQRCLPVSRPPCFPSRHMCTSQRVRGEFHGEPCLRTYITVTFSSRLSGILSDICRLLTINATLTTTLPSQQQYDTQRHNNKLELRQVYLIMSGMANKTGADTLADWAQDATCCDSVWSQQSQSRVREASSYFVKK